MPDPVCDPSKTNCFSETDPYPDCPPRLVVAINRYGDKQNINRKLKPRSLPKDDPAGDDSAFTPAGAIYVGEILEWVAKGFAASEMALAWATDAGKDGEVGPGVSTGEAALERDWARQIAEMFLQSGYAMPGETAYFPKLFTYAGSGLQVYQPQTYIYQRLQLEYVPRERWGEDTARPTATREKNLDPAYSLVTECQQLTTYIIISRGFLIERDMMSCGVTAGAASRDCQMFKSTREKPPGGNWIAHTADPQFTSAKHAIDDLKLTPGSIYVFDPKHMGAHTNIQAPGSHIWPVLRIDAANSRFQNLEGGGPPDNLPAPPWVAPETPINAYLPLKQGSSGDSRHEGPWRTSGASPGGACGLGIAPKADRLADALAHMKRARPVGLARLAIQRRTPPPAETPNAPAKFDLLYLSSFVRMWGDDPEENYAPSRFLLSLRSTPYFEDLQTYWFIYAPRHYLAYVMWSELARQYRPGDFFVEALKNEWAYEKTSGPKRTHLTANDLLCVLVLTHDQMGFAKVAWRYDVLVTKPLLDKDKKPVLYKGQPMNVPVTPIADGMDPSFFGGPTSEGLLPNLGVRWDAEYFHPSIAPGGRQAPAFFDFEQVFVPETSK